MATEQKRRPDAIADQQAVLDKAMSKAATTMKAPPPALDTFNAAPLATPAAAAAGAVVLGREDDGLQRPGGADDNDGDNGRPNDLTTDEAIHADGAGTDSWNETVKDTDRDGDGVADDATDPFDFGERGRGRVADELTNSIPQDDSRSDGPGTAAGRRPPGSGSDDGSASSESGGSGSGGGHSSDYSGGGGSNSHAGRTDPFTGQGVGFDAYGKPGDATTTDLAAGFGRPGNPLDGNAEFAATMGRLNDSKASDGFPSVADGGTDPLSQAYAYANSRAGEEATAKKHGVTPSGGGSGEAEDTETEAEAAPPEEKGFWDSVTDWFKGTTDGSGTVERYEEDLPTDVHIPRESTTNAAGSKAAGINNLEAAMGTALGTKKGGTAPGGGAKDRPPDGEDTGGPPTPGEVAFRRYLYNATNYQGGPGHNEGVTNPADEPTDIGPAFAPNKTGMIGQPATDIERATGGSGSLEVLPGDIGTVNPGEDDTGAWTNNAQTDQPEDALDGFGGPELTLSDAHKDDDEDDDEEDDTST